MMSLLISRSSTQSLYRRLCISISALTICGIVLGALASWAVSKHLSEKHYREVAAAASAVSSGSFHTRGPFLSKDPAVVIETLQADGRQVESSQPTIDLPLVPPGVVPVKTTDGKSWEILSLQAGENRIEIAEPIATQSKQAWESAVLGSVPLLLLLPVLIWMIGASVRMALRPLDAVARRITGFDIGRIEPVGFDEAPSELHPFLDSIESLMTRVAKQVEAERLFIADAAHEMRTPITALQLQIDNVLRSPPECLLARLTDLRRGVDRTAGLVEQLLSLAAADATATASRAPLSVGSVVTGVVADLVDMAAFRDVDLGVERLDHCYILAQESEARVLIKNLVDNAIRYGGRGGRVDVEVVCENDAAAISISDTGPGIPEQERASVFKRFHRGHSVDEQGSGLGLAIAETVARNLGASITLSDRGDGRPGLTVTVRIPIIGSRS